MTPDSAEQVADPDMSQFELDVLRTMNGDDVPGMVAGAAMWAAAAWLKGRGYATGHYVITKKGVDYLAALRTAATLAREGADNAG